MVQGRHTDRFLDHPSSEMGTCIILYKEIQKSDEICSSLKSIPFISPIFPKYHTDFASLNMLLFINLFKDLVYIIFLVL